MRSSHAAIVIVAIFGLGYSATFLHYHLPFGIDSALPGIILYDVGNMARKVGLIQQITSRKATSILLIPSLLRINILFGVVLNEKVSMYDYRLGNYLYFYISALSGTLFVALISALMPQSKIINYYAMNTLIIFPTHYFLLEAYKIADWRLFGGGTTGNDIAVALILLIITMVFYIPAIYIARRFVPILAGR